MHFTFEANHGAAPLWFGDKRDETRQRMAKFTLSTRPILPRYDVYSSEGVKLGFDAQDLLAFIEIRDPSTASFRQLDFFALDFATILEDLNAFGLSKVFTVGCYIFPEAGMSIYAPNQEVLSVSLYQQGYYDDVLAHVAK